MQFSNMNIRNIAICLIEHDHHIFVAEGYDSVKQETFYRPLGGGIEFGETAGETAAEAAIREFKEELDTEISVQPDYQVYENIFQYCGKLGHEVVFALKAQFADDRFYDRRDFTANEGSLKFVARWVDKAEFISGNKILYPAGLSASLY